MVKKRIKLQTSYQKYSGLRAKKEITCSFCIWPMLTDLVQNKKKKYTY